MQGPHTIADIVSLLSHATCTFPPFSGNHCVIGLNLALAMIALFCI